MEKRPKFLTWLSIGSIVVGVLWVIMYIALILSKLYGKVDPYLFPGIVIEYSKVGYSFLLAEILFTLFGLAGVIMMRKMKIAGLYIYAFAKVILFFLPVVFIGSSQLSFPILVITSVLITAYGVMLTGIHKKD
jgi:hypothetical protein